jgi:hypothetical protein
MCSASASALIFSMNGFSICRVHRSIHAHGPVGCAPLSAPAARHPAPAGPARQPTRAGCLRGWPADEAGGMLVASAAQGVHSRRGCGKIPFEFPIHATIASVLALLRRVLSSPALLSNSFINCSTCVNSLRLPSSLCSNFSMVSRTSGRIQTERYGFTLHEPDFDFLNGFSGRFIAQKSP